MHFPFSYYERALCYYIGHKKEKRQHAQMTGSGEVKVFSDDENGIKQKILDSCTNCLVYNPTSLVKRWEKIEKWENFLGGGDGILAILDFAEKLYEMDYDIKDLIEDLEEFCLEFDKAKFMEIFADNHNAMELGLSTSAAATLKLYNRPSTSAAAMFTSPKLDKSPSTSAAAMFTSPKLDNIPFTSPAGIFSSPKLNDTHFTSAAAIFTTPKLTDRPSTSPVALFTSPSYAATTFFSAESDNRPSTSAAAKYYFKEIQENKNITPKLCDTPSTSARSTWKLDVTPSRLTATRYNLKTMVKAEKSTPEPEDQPKLGAIATARNSLKKSWIPAYVERLLRENTADLIQIGPNGTTVSRRCLEEILWSKGGPNATRKILSEVFGRDILASHTLSGKESPAFRGMNKPLKSALDEWKVGDIIDAMKNIFPDMTEKEVRSSITTKCADENKMLRLKALKLHKKKE